MYLHTVDGTDCCSSNLFPFFAILIENSLLDNYEIRISFLLWETNVFKESYYNTFS